MCGVVSLVYDKDISALGAEASELLKRLEYRGYDSTGASFITHSKIITLLKKVGAPSKVTQELNIPAQSGQRFIGQVRWATYGAVTDINSQPHHVLCKQELIGAHNGNISNTDALKARLITEGHHPKSDNDGEMLVHLVEEHYAQLLKNNEGPSRTASAAFEKAGTKTGLSARHLVMVEAIRQAEAEAIGSYAACVADPDIDGVFAMKSGSSLYAGIGTDANGSFVVVSSDLSSVLSKTKMLIPLLEGQGIWFNHNSYIVFTLSGNLVFSEPAPKRSQLSVQDTGLHEPYKFYMHQEIASSPDNIETIKRYYLPDPLLDFLTSTAAGKAAETVLANAEALAQTNNQADFAEQGRMLFASKAWAALKKPIVHRFLNTYVGERRHASDLAFILDELATLLPDYKTDIALLDTLAVERKRQEIRHSYQACINTMYKAHKRGGTIYILASGTSYHAALIGSYFFGGLAKLPVFPCNPGLFRGNYLNTLTAHDLIIAISQSGETKDLVDILQDAKQKEPSIKRISIVNNENSRIPQELSDFYLPILCGPEIAVAATKSFISQLAVLYLLAGARAMTDEDLEDSLGSIRALLEATIKTAFPQVDAIADILFLAPSMHILGTGLIGLAKEGALKIREVVLNHAEGYDAAEFKHGPNTILGKNTLFSLDQLERIWAAAHSTPGSGTAAQSASQRATSVQDTTAFDGNVVEPLFHNYPLVFICPPDEHDRHITISQIHTHKIRGADIFLIGEPDKDLALAVEGLPAGLEGRYRSCFITMPISGNRYHFVFGSALVLQYLALRMSILKKEKLDALHIEDHGVHPDAPKNVSKSITVD